MPRTKTSSGLKAPSPQKIFQLRVSLRYIQPAIWRRILVPDNWVLGELHPALVAAMGWGGYHLHAFRFGGGFNPIVYSTYQMVVECGPRMLDEDQVLLGSLIRRKGQTFSYEYDFGDSWQHEVKVEKILPYDHAVALPVCLAGARACPPEDCGSFPGYANLLRVLKKAETPEDRRLRKWVGRYDPEHFNVEGVNGRLQPRSGGFFQCQLKEEIARKAFGVTFDRLDQGPGLDFIESGEIGIQDDPLLADTTNQGSESMLKLAARPTRV